MTADECTACYQLRAKRTGLSRQSTLSLSRITVCKETPVRPPYDLCYFPIIDGNRQYVYNPNIPSVMGPMHAICLQLKVIEQSCSGDNVMGSALVLLLLSPAHRDHSPLPESNHSSHRASITPYIVPHWPRSTTRHLYSQYLFGLSPTMDFSGAYNNMQPHGQAQFDSGSGIEQDYPMQEPQYAPPPNLEPPTAHSYTANEQPHFGGHDPMQSSEPLPFGTAVPELVAYEAHTPNELEHVQLVFDAFVAGYNREGTINEVQMDVAKDLATSLLNHYYPASEGYVVEPSSLGPMAKRVTNLMLKTAGGLDLNYDPLPPLPAEPFVKDPKKGKNQKRKALNKAQLAYQAHIEANRQFAHQWACQGETDWHQIKPENISGFEVFKKHTITRDGIDSVETRLHTCLAIVVAPHDLLPRIATNNDVNRGDLLTDVLCGSQQIRRGHGMLLFGTYLEFYDFDNGEETQVVEDDEEADSEGMISHEEPFVRLCQAEDGQRLSLDLRQVGLGTVDEVCRMVVRKEVERIEQDVGAAGQQFDGQMLGDMGYAAAPGQQFGEHMLSFIADAAAPGQQFSSEMRFGSDLHPGAVEYPGAPNDVMQYEMAENPHEQPQGLPLWARERPGKRRS
jgi:hypothetical protein